MGFEGGNYDTCLVNHIKRDGDFVSIDAPDSAKYSSSMQGGVHTHLIETFIGDLSADQQSQLQLATTRRYVVIFRTHLGGQFTFGYESGATVAFNNQTSEDTGALVQITGKSIHPLFELLDLSVEWAGFVNIWQYMPNDIACEWAGFINVWERACYNDFNFDFSIDFNCSSPTDPYVFVTEPQLWYQSEPGEDQQIDVYSDTDWIVE
jgi:hypothetical protein